MGRTLRNFENKPLTQNNDIVGVYNARKNSFEQFTDYYPYGLPHASISSEAAGAGVNRHKFGGKELMSDHGYNSYDFAARYLTTGFPVFTTSDLLQERHYPISAYAYCSNNPINYSDPTGLDWVEVNNSRKIIWLNEATSSKNTPNGYKYIGPTNDDILRFYGLKSIYTERANGRAFGLAGQFNKKYGSGSGYLAMIDSHIAIRVEETCEYDSKGLLSKKEFKGLTIYGIVIQSKNVLYNENALFYNGGLQVSYNNVKRYSLLTRSDFVGTNFLPVNTISHSTTIFIPANELFRGGSFSVKKIEINLGATNPRYLFVTPINVIYKK